MTEFNNDRGNWQDYSGAYDEAIKEWSQFWVEAETDLKYYLGDQISANDQAYYKGQRRSIGVWNKIKRQIRMLSGWQIANRLSMKVEALQGGINPTANLLSECLQWSMTYGDGYRTMSKAWSQGPLKTGLNLVRLWLDYADDPFDGDFKISRLPYNLFLLDPHFSGSDLKDCNYILARRWVDKESLPLLIKDKAKNFESVRPSGWDSKFTSSWSAQNWDGSYLFRFDEFYRREKKVIPHLLDLTTRKMVPWKGSKSRLDQFLRMPVDDNSGMNYGQRYVKIDKPHDTVRLVLMVEEETVYDGPELLGIDDYPFACCLGFFDPEYRFMDWKVQSLIRCMRSPQDEINRKKMKFLDMLESQIGSGWKTKEGAVVDRNALYRTGQGVVVTIADDFEMGDAEKLEPPIIPDGVIRAIEMQDRDLIEIPGFNEEMVAGSVQADMSPILSKMRQGAGLMNMQDLMDDHRFANGDLGNKMIKAIQANWSPEKVMQVTGKQPTPEFFDKNWGKYNCKPTEGLLTDAQREMFFAQLVAMKQMEAPIPWSLLLQYSPLERADEVLQAVDTSEKQSGQAQMQQLKSQQILDSLTQAEAVSRISSAETKGAQAQADLAMADLNRAKAAAEIMGMGTENFVKVMQVALAMEQMFRAAESGGTNTESSSNVVPMKRQSK